MSATRLSFAYTTELKEQIKQVADGEERNVSQMVRIFIKEGLERRLKGVKSKKKFRKKIKL